MKKKLKKKKKEIKFIPCDEFSQTYNWQKTNKHGKLKTTK